MALRPFAGIGRTNRASHRSAPRRERPALGLDIGSHVVKLVAVGRGTPVRVTVAASVPLPPDAVTDGTIVDPEAVIETLQALAADRSLPTHRVATAVSGRSIIARTIWMDAVADGDLEQAIEWEAEQNIPFDLHEVYLDHQVLRSDETGKRLQVLIVAAKRDAVDQLTTMVRDAGFHPAVVDVDAFAAYNAVMAREPLGENEAHALVEIGAEFTNVLLAGGEGPLLTSSVSFGTAKLVDAALKQFPVSRDEVEAALAAPDASADLAAIVTETAEELSVGIERAVSYVDTRALGDAPGLARLVLCGGGACLPSLVAFLRRRHRVPVVLADPLEWMDTSEVEARGPVRRLAPMYAVGLGLALRHLEN